MHATIEQQTAYAPVITTPRPAKPPSVEFLLPRRSNASAEPMLRALTQAALAAGHPVRESRQATHRCEWLVLFGVGSPAHDAARSRQIAQRGRCIHWDHGYVAREKLSGHLRLSIDQDHPQLWLDATAPDPSRWDSLGVPMREDAHPSGPIILVGLGAKSRLYLKAPDWEARTLATLERRFPGRSIIHRPKPKPGQDFPKLHCERDIDTPIADLLRGASLVVCRHSNVAVDATIAGVPFECEDGAAAWLTGKPFTADNRLDFLRRLAWWQWRAGEAAQAWAFIVATLANAPAPLRFT